MSALFVSSDLPPNVCKKSLVLVRPIGLDEPHLEEKPRHLGTVYHYVKRFIVLICIQPNIQALVCEVLIELLINVFVWSCTDLGCVFVSLSFLRHYGWNCLLLALTPHSILVENICWSSKPLRDAVWPWIDLGFKSLFKRFLLKITHLTSLHNRWGLWLRWR